MKTDFRDINEYPDTWSIFQGDRDKKPIFVRLRDGLSKAQGHNNFPFQIGIAVRLANPTPDGMITELESKKLEIIEDQLEQVLTKNKEAVLALIITFNGMREFVFYASKWEPEYFEQMVRALNNQHKEYQLQFIMQEDKNWNTFREFAS